MPCPALSATLSDVPPSPHSDAALIERQIRAAGSPQRAASEQNYLKSTLEFAGATVPQTRAIVLSWRRQARDLTRQHVTTVADALWDTPLYESRLAAVILLADRKKLIEAPDAGQVERMLRTAGTWALVDGLAADVAGSLAERFPAQLQPVLDRWATDPDFWLRRSALLALLVPLRRGDRANFEWFSRYADKMLDEREFFIRKAIGWVLRETGKRHPDLVIDWLTPRIGRASGVTVREAVRWLPAGPQAELLTAYRSRKAG